MSIEAVGLVKTFGGLHAVDGFSLRLDRGEIVGLIGPNGAGKTTSFNLLTGQLKPTAGTVHVDGTDATGKPPWELARLGVARTFQHAATFRSLSVLDNVLTALAARNLVKRAERRTRAEDLLKSVPPDAALDSTISELPYGVQRRVALAIALANEPKYILLDEPAAGLNPAETHVLGTAIKDVAAAGVGVLLVEHDLVLVSRVVARLSVLAAGRPLFTGTPAAAMRESSVREAYIGKRGVPDA